MSIFTSQITRKININKQLNTLKCINNLRTRTLEITHTHKERERKRSPVLEHKRHYQTRLKEPGDEGFLHILRLIYKKYSVLLL